METDNSISRPDCVASTGDELCAPLSNPGYATRVAEENNLFRNAQFSGDGTTIITHNEDQKLRTYILPPDLLASDGECQHLISQSTWASPSNILSYAIYPWYNINDSISTLVLSASVDMPIRLAYAQQNYTSVCQTYKFVNSNTEQYMKPHSLAFDPDGVHFLAGSENTLALFDLHNTDPINTHTTATTPSFAGNISSLSISNDNVLATGTLQRQVSLFENCGKGSYITSFPVNQATHSGDKGLRGTGITKLAWSPCGTYLLVAERQSDVIQVWDLRNMGYRVCCLIGRQAYTSQKLGFDIEPTLEGFNVWAGGTDGIVRMWKNPGSLQGRCEPNYQMKMHEDAISGTIWSPAGSLMATCSGQRSGYDVDSDSELDDSPSIPDNRLHVWNMDILAPRS